MAGFIISEKNDVTLPVGVCCDGFFVTHARGYVRMQDRGMKFPPREAWRGAVPVLDAGESSRSSVPRRPGPEVELYGL